MRRNKRPSYVLARDYTAGCCFYKKIHCSERVSDTPMRVHTQTHMGGLKNILFIGKKVLISKNFGDVCLVSSNHPIPDTQLAKSWQTNSAMQHGLLVAQRQLIAFSTFSFFPLSTQTYFSSYKTKSSPSSQRAGSKIRHIPACSFKNWPALPHIQRGKSQSPLTAVVIFHSLMTAPVKRVC